MQDGGDVYSSNSVSDWERQPLKPMKGQKTAFMVEIFSCKNVLLFYYV
jgi:hypothetical protein